MYEQKKCIDISRSFCNVRAANNDHEKENEAAIMKLHTYEAMHVHFIVRVVVVLCFLPFFH